MTTPTERAYILDRSRLVTEAVVANLSTIQQARLPCAMPLNGGGGTFVVVGAGPSLVTAGPWLKRLQEHGALICTVNTALKKVVEYVEPDVVLCREIVDVSSHFDTPKPYGMRVLDVGCNPKVFSASLERPGITSWFIPAQLGYFELAAMLGVRPLYGGSAALTALVSLVREWGAGAVILAGVDLAKAADGAGYAPGTAFGDYHVSESGAVSGKGLEAKAAQHLQGGTQPPTTQMGLRTVEAWGGKGTVQAMQVYWDQLEWLGTFAERNPSIGLIDASRGGARKRGWREMDISCAIEFCTITELPWLERPERARWDMLRADLDWQIQTTLDVCANVLHPQGFPMGVPNLLRGTDLVDMAAAKALLQGFESNHTIAEKIQHAYGTAFPDGAKAIHKQLTSWVTTPASHRTAG